MVVIWGIKVVSTENKAPEQGELIGDFGLTPIQKIFFESKYANANYVNQSVILEVNSKLTKPFLNAIFSVIVKYHDIFRATFNEKFQTYTSKSFVDISSKTIHDYQEIELDANLIQASLDIHKGPLCKVVLYEYPGNKSKLLIVAHHLIIDGVSWRILIDDINSIYRSFISSGSVSLPPKSFSYRQWESALQASVSKFSSEVDYWNNIQRKIESCSFNLPQPIGNDCSAKHLKIRLDEETTSRLIRNIPEELNVHINSVLLTALVLAVGNVTGEYKLGFALEGHGREDIIGLDVSRTIGWFTSIFPVFLELDCPQDLKQSIIDANKILESIPNKGIGFSVLSRYTNEIDTSIPKISFNYLGQWNSAKAGVEPFSYSDCSSGSDVDPNNEQLSSLDINCEVKLNQFVADFSYKQNCFKEDFIKDVAMNFENILIQIVQLCHCA